MGLAGGEVPRAWSRAERIGFALFAVAVFGSLGLTTHPWYDLRNADSGLYIATARSIASGEGYTHLGLPFTNRPPGFSWTLARVIGSGEIDFRALNLFVGLFGAAAVVLLALFQRARLGWGLALLTALAVWLNPEFQRLCNQTLSDVPGAAILILCLGVERWAARSSSWRRELVLGLCVALAVYFRAAALLLVPAIVASRLIEQFGSREARPSWRSFAGVRVALLVAVVFAAVLPWSLHTRESAPPPPVDQTGVYSYWTAMWHEDPGDPRSPGVGVAGLLERVPTRSLQISGALGSRLRTGVPSPVNTGIALLGLAGLAVTLWRRRAPAEIFAGGSLLLLLFYFDLRPRLLLPVYLIAFPATVEAIRGLIRRFASPRVATGFTAAGLCLLLAVDFAPRRDWPSIRENHEAFAAICSSIQSVLDPDERVATAFNWHYATCLDRPVYSLLFAVRRGDGPEAAEAIIDKYDIDTVILTPIWVLDKTLFPYFKQRYGVTQRVGAAYLIRVRP